MTTPSSRAFERWLYEALPPDSGDSVPRAWSAAWRAANEHAGAPALLAAARQLVAANAGEDVDWQDIDDATEAARDAIESATP